MHGQVVTSRKEGLTELTKLSAAGLGIAISAAPYSVPVSS
jgi:hypothetical protein